MKDKKRRRVETVSFIWQKRTLKFFIKGKGKNANGLAQALALMLKYNKEESPSYPIPGPMLHLLVAYYTYFLFNKALIQVSMSDGDDLETF